MTTFGNTDWILLATPELDPNITEAPSDAKPINLSKRISDENPCDSRHFNND